jgi:hypothetical protein
MPKVKIPKQSNITVVKDMRDYSNDPFVIKKAEKAAAFLEKHPLPKEITQPKKKSK